MPLLLPGSIHSISSEKRQKWTTYLIIRIFVEEPVVPQHVQSVVLDVLGVFVSPHFLDNGDTLFADRAAPASKNSDSLETAL